MKNQYIKALKKAENVPETDSFPSLIAAEKEYSLVNYGTDGLTSASLLASLSNPQVAADVASADVITITIGGNDLMGALYSYIAAQKDDGTTADDVKVAFEKKDLVMLKFALDVIDGFAASDAAGKAVEDFTTNFGTVIAAVRKASPDVALFVATQYNPYKWLPDQCTDVYHDQIVKIAGAFNTGVSVLNGVINKGAGSGAYTVVDVYSAFNASGDNLSNAKYSSMTIGSMVIPSVELDFQPNAAGHEVIASTFGGEIEAAIADAVDKTFNSIASAVLSLSNASVAQTDIISAEQAKAWAESRLKSVIPAGVSSEVVITDFVAATAGTAQNKAGTNGSFNVAVKLSWLGTAGTTEAAQVSIQATAYTEPAVTPGNDDDEKADGTVDDKENDNKNEKPAAQDTKKPAKDTYASPETGDSTAFMPYVVLLLAAAAAAAAAVTARRKMSGR